MGTYITPGDHRVRAPGLRVVSDAAALNTTRLPVAISLETDERVSLRVAVAVAILPSMALWAVIWYALNRLITNWP